jgi:drug/metabolite transporter (DMT)-like permease
LIGHTSFNGLRYVPAIFVSIATQMEPIASAIAAFIVLQKRQPRGRF